MKTRVGKSSNSCSHLVWNSDAPSVTVINFLCSCQIWTRSNFSWESSSIIKYEPNTRKLQATHQEFSLVYPTLDDTWWELKKTLVPQGEAKFLLNSCYSTKYGSITQLTKNFHNNDPSRLITTKYLLSLSHLVWYIGHRMAACTSRLSSDCLNLTWTEFLPNIK